jgi:putative hydrolase of the HAD superfamily
LLFDWGDTLMVDDPQCQGSMAFWEKVSPMPGVTETLPLLRQHYKCVVASNAGDSDAELMHRAFERVALDQYFFGYITSKELGATKPSPRFFQGVLDHFSIPLDEAVMIGNDYAKDISGAKAIGLATIFITEEAGDYPDADCVISSFDKLCDCLPF